MLGVTHIPGVSRFSCTKNVDGNVECRKVINTKKHRETEYGKVINIAKLTKKYSYGFNGR